MNTAIVFYDYDVRDNMSFEKYPPRQYALKILLASIMPQCNVAHFRKELRREQLSTLSSLKSQNILREHGKMSEKLRAAAKHVKIILYRIR